MNYALIARASGGVIADFDSRRAALEFVRRNMSPSDKWALFELGDEPSHTRRVFADAELHEAARIATAGLLIFPPETSWTLGPSVGWAVASRGSAYFRWNAGRVFPEPVREIGSSGGSARIVPEADDKPATGSGTAIIVGT